MQAAQPIRFVLLLLLLFLSGWVAYYFWTHQSLEAIRILPREIKIACLIYVIAQLLKRFIYKKRYWFDWLYYIGLIAAMLPTFFVTSNNESTFHLLTDFGTPFLLIPVILEFYTLFKQKA